ncbi:Hypothetical predicted protein [Mytilus galloprovincialis]|uniref:Uncharacterized protein n=1 Tax=Mytilus galloprovincialis TaxID=29158 RepID=A0A8B6DSM0_MYTGA|nr:Hypothetical predicted protein [Mytilus galloprovincialis]
MTQITYEQLKRFEKFGPVTLAVQRRISSVEEKVAGIIGKTPINGIEGGIDTCLSASFEEQDSCASVPSPEKSKRLSSSSCSILQAFSLNSSDDDDAVDDVIVTQDMPSSSKVAKLDIPTKKVPKEIENERLKVERERLQIKRSRYEVEKDRYNLKMQKLEIEKEKLEMENGRYNLELSRQQLQIAEHNQPSFRCLIRVWLPIRRKAAVILNF